MRARKIASVTIWWDDAHAFCVRRSSFGKEKFRKLEKISLFRIDAAAFIRRNTVNAVLETSNEIIHPQKCLYIPAYNLDPSERDLWVAALHYKVNSTSNVRIRICRLFWPSGNIPMPKKRRFARPRDPSFLFNGLKSLHGQTTYYVVIASYSWITLPIGASKDQRMKW